MITPNFSPFPTLQSERLLLRQFCEDDVPSFFALRREEQVMQFIGKPPMQTLEEAKELFDKIQANLERNDGISWAMSLKGSTELLGTIALWRIDKDNHRAEIGYMLFPKCWQCGYVSEAMPLVLQYGFEVINLHSIEGQTDSRNEASQRVLKKFGFEQEAYFKENFYFNGEFSDTTVFSLLKNAWQSHNLL